MRQLPVAGKRGQCHGWPRRDKIIGSLTGRNELGSHEFPVSHSGESPSISTPFRHWVNGLATMIVNKLVL
jgi:hypothetical protein